MSTISIETAILKNAVSVAMKGCESDKFNPLTSMMEIFCELGNLTVTTSGLTHTLYVKRPIANQSNFRVVVEAAVFAKLIGKITTPTVSFTVDGNSMSIVGNGSYKIELPVDPSTGMLIVYPHLALPECECAGKTDPATLYTVVSANKTCVAVNDQNSAMDGYWIGQVVIGSDGEAEESKGVVITTDRTRVCVCDADIIKGNFLLNSSEVKLLPLLESAEISVYKRGRFLEFVANGVTLVAYERDGIKNYEWEGAMQIANHPFKAFVKLDRAAVLETLGRITILTDAFSDGGVELTFREREIEISTTRGSETISYIDTSLSDSAAFKADVLASDLISMLKSQNDETATVWFDDEMPCLKFEDGIVTQVLAFVGDDE